MTSLTSAQTHRAAGVLLAAAAGDALGAGYEFTYPRLGQPIAMIGGGLGNFAPGEWTDDTSMTVAIAEVAATGVDLRTPAGLDAVAAGFVRWYDSRPADIGIQTRRVLSARDTTGAAMQATAAALPGRTGGNGSLMRTAPVALAYLHDPTARAEAAAAVSSLTHADPRAAEACQIWCDLIAGTVLTGEIDREWTFLGELGEGVETFWRPLKDAAETGQPADFAKNGWVVHALQTAWWAMTHAAATDAHQLAEGLELAVRAGGDTDTTAAIAGAVLGARWGASAVPADWRRILHGWPGLRDHDLIRLAIETVQGGPRPGKWPSVEIVDYAGWDTGHATVHPNDDGVILGGVDAVQAGGYDAVVSLCRMGSAELGVEHLRFWLVDAGPGSNPNLDFVLDDAARMVQTLRSEGKRVLLHCVEGRSRTPSVAARYSMLLGENPYEVLDAMSWSHPDPGLWRATVAGTIAGMAASRRNASSDAADPLDSKRRKVEILEQLEAHLVRWSVPAEVRVMLRSAVAVAGQEGVKLSDGGTNDYASIAARGKPIAVFVGRTRVSIALDPEVAAQAANSDDAFGLEKDSGVTWFIHCSYVSLGEPARLDAVKGLVVEAFRRSARNARDEGRSNSEERRRAAVEADVPRCPVPGCNLPMVGGSCGFHD